MMRAMLIGAALVGTLVSGLPTTVHAQPPTPPEIVSKIDHGVRRAVTHTDRALRAVHRTRHHARNANRRATHRSVRAVCYDGRVHTGRSRAAACANHRGLKG